MKTAQALAAVLLLTLLAAQRVGAMTNHVLDLRTSADYITIPDSDSLDLIDNLSFEAWVNVAVMSNDGTIIGKRRATAGTAYAFRVSAGKAVLGMNNDFGDGKGVNFAITSAAEIPLSQWTHVAATYDGTTAKVYINGVLKASSPIKMQLRASTLPVTIGREDLPGDPRAFLGLIDEVRVWNRALSQAEIQANMSLRLSGQESGLVGYWNFDDQTGRDLSGFGNQGTLVGNARFVEDPLVLLQVHRAVEILSLSGSASASYQLQFKTNVSSTTWVNFGQPFVGGKQMQFFDTTRDSAQKVYRVIKVQ